MIEYTRGRPNGFSTNRALLRIARNTLDLQAGGGTVAAGGGPGGQTLAGPGSPLSATDHADHRPDRAAGASWRSSAGRRASLSALFEPHADIIVKGSRDVDYGISSI